MQDPVSDTIFLTPGEGALLVYVPHSVSYKKMSLAGSYGRPERYAILLGEEMVADKQASLLKLRHEIDVDPMYAYESVAEMIDRALDSCNTEIRYMLELHTVGNLQNFDVKITVDENRRKAKELSESLVRGIRDVLPDVTVLYEGLPDTPKHPVLSYVYEKHGIYAFRLTIADEFADTEFERRVIVRAFDAWLTENAI